MLNILEAIAFFVCKEWNAKYSMKNDNKPPLSLNNKHYQKHIKDQMREIAQPRSMSI